MPSLFTVHGYRIFFWSNENTEPIHIHIAKGTPGPCSAKVWLTRSGGCVIANNDAHIPRRDLDELLDIVAAQHDYICAKWREFFVTDEVSFFC